MHRGNMVQLFDRGYDARHSYLTVRQRLIKWYNLLSSHLPCRYKPELPQIVTDLLYRGNSPPTHSSPPSPLEVRLHVPSQIHLCSQHELTSPTLLPSSQARIRGGTLARSCCRIRHLSRDLGEGSGSSLQLFARTHVTES